MPRLIASETPVWAGTWSIKDRRFLTVVPHVKRINPAPRAARFPAWAHVKQPSGKQVKPKCFVGCIRQSEFYADVHVFDVANDHFFIQQAAMGIIEAKFQLQDIADGKLARVADAQFHSAGGYISDRHGPPAGFATIDIVYIASWQTDLFTVATALFQYGDVIVPAGTSDFDAHGAGGGFESAGIDGLGFLTPGTLEPRRVLA
jgi:hypothetical protein